MELLIVLQAVVVFFIMLNHRLFEKSGRTIGCVLVFISVGFVAASFFYGLTAGLLFMVGTLIWAVLVAFPVKIISSFYNSVKHTKAISDYTQAIKLNPDDAEAYFNRGLSYGILGKFTESISDFTEAIKLNPYNAAWFYFRGNAYYDINDRYNALKDWEKTIELEPGMADNLKPYIEKCS